MKKFKYLQIVLFAIGLITSSYVQAQCEFTTSPEQTACSGEEVMLEATSGGGTFEWFDGPTSIGSGPTISVSPTLTTSYTVVHTDGLCKDTNIVTVNVLPFSVSTTVTNATCDSDNGAVTVNTIGGTAPFSFSLNGNEPVMDNTFTGLTPGSYTTQVMDANGCIEMESFEIQDVIVGTLTLAGDTSICEGEISYLTAYGSGTFEWFEGPTSLGTGSTIDVSPLSTTTYSAVLTDSNGCENSGQVTVTVFPSVEIVATVTDASCGQNNGFIQVEPSGGGQASYTIDGGDFNEDGMFNNLYPGTYEIEMTTNSVCVNKEYITVNDTPPISLTNNISNATCGENNGSVTVLAAGGTPPFSYSIDGNEPVMDNTFTGLTPGSYTTQVMDANGCIEMESFEIQDVIVGTLTLAGDTSICEGEISYLTAYGSGTFEWFEGATSLGTGSTIDVSPLSTTTYEVVFTDSNDCTASENISVTVSSSPTIEINNVINTGCNENTGEVHATVISPNGTYNAYWNNGAQNSDFITGLNAGDYYINVIDEDGCKGQASAVVETSGLDITGTVTDVNCNNGSDGKIEINIVGGSGNNIIKWSNGNNTTNVTGLNAGEYSVRVTDLDSGCVAYKSFVVEEPVDIFEVYFYDYSPSTCVSNDGVIKEFQPYNGNAPYQFIWSNGETGDSISDLSSGRYSVVVTDALGCEADFEVTLNNPDAPFVQGTVKAASCNESDGAINLSDLSPTPGETITGYEWSNGVTTQNNTNLAAGEYTLEVSQSNGCVGKFGYTVKHKSFDYTPEICIVTVDTATNTNLIVWEKEEFNPRGIAYYKVYRANASSGQYQLVDTVHHSSMSVFNDVVASPERRSWMYKISAVNDCGIESRLSKHHKTIHLVMTDGPSPNSKKLTWDHYEGLEYFYYDLYRKTDVDGWQLIQDSIEIITLPDFIDTLPTGATHVDYIVEVVPVEGGCTADYGRAQDYNSSRSNKPSPIFEPSGEEEEEDPSSGLVSYENEGFKAVVYPNPSNGTFNIDILENTNNQALEMLVVGVNGNIIHKQALDNDLNTVHLNVDSGIYFIKIFSETSLETIRVVVQ